MEVSFALGNLKKYIQTMCLKTFLELRQIIQKLKNNFSLAGSERNEAVWKLSGLFGNRLSPVIYY